MESALFPLFFFGNDDTRTCSLPNVVIDILQRTPFSLNVLRVSLFSLSCYADISIILYFLSYTFQFYFCEKFTFLFSRLLCEHEIGNVIRASHERRRRSGFTLMSNTPRRIELSSWQGDPVLQSFKCAITLKGKWLTKSPADLITLFLKHYFKQYGVTRGEAGPKLDDELPHLWRPEDDFELCTSLGVALSIYAELKVVPGVMQVRSRYFSADTFDACCRAVEECPPERRPTTGGIYHLLEGDCDLKDLPNPGLYGRVAALFLNVGTLPAAPDSVMASALRIEIEGFKAWRALSGERRKALKTAIIPRRMDLAAALGCNLVRRSRWLRSTSTPPTSPLLSYVARNVCNAKSGALWTYEASVAVSEYIEERLAVKPLGYRGAATQISLGDVASFLKRVRPALDIRLADDLQSAIQRDRPAIILIDAWAEPAAVQRALPGCKGGVSSPDDEEGLQFDVPEVLIFGPVSLLQLELQGYKNVHLDHLSTHLLHANDDPHAHFGTFVCIALRATNNRLSAFRDPAEVAHSKAQGTVARIIAQAQRGTMPDAKDLALLEEANEVIAGTPNHIKHNVRTPLQDDED